MGMGKLNVYYVNSELKIGNTVTSIASAYFSNATEEEFKNLLDNFLANNDFNSGLFMSYVAQNGYFCTVLDKEVLTPSS
ncbi:MAG: hypothetical protein ACXVHT_03335 [Methanobacterium sp.]